MVRWLVSVWNIRPIDPTVPYEETVAAEKLTVATFKIHTFTNTTDLTKFKNNVIAQTKISARYTDSKQNVLRCSLVVVFHFPIPFIVYQLCRAVDFEYLRSLSSWHKTRKYQPDKWTITKVIDFANCYGWQLVLFLTLVPKHIMQSLCGINMLKFSVLWE